MDRSSYSLLLEPFDEKAFATYLVVREALEEYQHLAVFGYQRPIEILSRFELQKRIKGRSSLHSIFGEPAFEGLLPSSDLDSDYTSRDIRCTHFDAKT